MTDNVYTVLDMMLIKDSVYLVACCQSLDTFSMLAYRLINLLNADNTLCVCKIVIRV